MYTYYLNEFMKFTHVIVNWYTIRLYFVNQVDVRKTLVIILKPTCFIIDQMVLYDHNMNFSLYIPFGYLLIYGHIGLSFYCAKLDL